MEGEKIVSPPPHHSHNISYDPEPMFIMKKRTAKGSIRKNNINKSLSKASKYVKHLTIKHNSISKIPTESISKSEKKFITEGKGSAASLGLRSDSSELVSLHFEGVGVNQHIHNVKNGERNAKGVLKDKN